MKKFTVYAAAAAIAMTAAMPITSQAAVKAFVVNGNSITSLGGLSLDNFANQLCGNSNLQIPGIQLPGTSIPDMNLPVIPDINVPDSSLPENNQPEQPPQGGETNSSFEQQVVNLVNQERAKAGLSPLSVSDSAASAAAIRAKEITTSFSHTRPDGSSFSTALTQTGTSFRGAGENIAYGQRTPQAVMESWMNSQGHRANILNSQYTSIGVGYYESNGVGYWTQLFTY